MTGEPVIFVVVLPPTPENSTFTVVAEAARSGPDFGTNRVFLELVERAREDESS